MPAARFAVGAPYPPRISGAPTATNRGLTLIASHTKARRWYKRITHSRSYLAHSKQPRHRGHRSRSCRLGGSVSGPRIPRPTLHTSLQGTASRRGMTTEQTQACKLSDNKYTPLTTSCAIPESPYRPQSFTAVLVPNGFQAGLPTGLPTGFGLAVRTVPVPGRPHS